MHISSNDGDNCAEVIKEVVTRISSLDAKLGQTDAQQEAMNSYIDSKCETNIENQTKERIKELLRDSNFPEEAGRAAQSWLRDNLSEKIQEQFDEMMCQKTQDTIEEYSLVKYDQLGEAISEEISNNDWSYTINDALDYDSISETVKSNIEEDLTTDMTMRIREDLKEDVDTAVAEYIKKDDNEIKGLVKSVIINMLTDHEWINATESSTHTQAARYRLILNEVGLDDNAESYQKLISGATKFKSEI